ncbi:hypothetical protein WDJ51_02215 [Rathayibacter sp. YIM 133350]|uniref:hypothetical protein n=1 Tax=Rathayibacter sp. YIM 133350 TaxID=3131992 RepID=UPI00307DC45E
MTTIRSPRPLWMRFGAEFVAVLIVFSAGVITLSKWYGTAWEINLLYSGDSLVLPLLHGSVIAREPFEWIFSSQLFFFPEAPLYFFVTLFVPSPRAALCGVAILNLILLYVLLRWCSRLLFRHSRHRIIEVSVALGATAMYVVYVLLEPVSDINGTAVASLYLLVAYYSGVIICGLACVGLTLWVTRAFTDPPVRTWRTVFYVILTGLVVALSAGSDPLFNFQVSAPLIATLVIAGAARRLRWRWLLITVGTIGAATLAGAVLHQLWGRFTSLSVSSYVNFDNLAVAFQFLKHVLRDTVSTPYGTLKLILAVGVLLITLLPIVRSFLGSQRFLARWHVTDAEFVLAVFSWVSVVSLLSGAIATGSLTTRYLEPLFVFPLLSASYETVRFFRYLLSSVQRAELRASLSRFGTALVSAIACTILIGAAIAAPNAVDMATSSSRGGAECTAKLPADAKAGVGTFWLTRNWEVYGSHRYPILQVNGDLTVFPAMINMASYLHQEFTFVVVDPWGFVTEDSVKPLGEPNSITECSGYRIYDYAGTPGQTELNAVVHASVDKVRRAHGFIP